MEDGYKGFIVIQRLVVLNK